MDTEALIYQRNQLNEILNKLKEEINNIELQMNEIDEQLYETEKTEELNELKIINDYLLENQVYFGKLNLKHHFQMMEYYGIKKYEYELGCIKDDLRNNLNIYHNDINIFNNNFDVSNISINEVPGPKNYIEKKIFSKICDYLNNHFPLKFEMKMTADNLYYIDLENSN